MFVVLSVCVRMCPLCGFECVCVCVCVIFCVCLSVPDCVCLSVFLCGVSVCACVHPNMRVCLCLCVKALPHACAGFVPVCVQGAGVPLTAFIVFTCVSMEVLWHVSQSQTRTHEHTHTPTPQRRININGVATPLAVK